ncbi:MAG: undecaprenyl-diphosphate phosphatase [Kiritimatiellae bacterium]|nr:undecaprenyl-diphosphate phosphatase [Kiritimatiellia bacterium]
MTQFIQVTILSLVQGVAEFLPISSSGHLVICKKIIGMDDPSMMLDIFLHAGTLLAVFLFYRHVIFRILARREWSYVFKIALSAVPAGVIGLFLYERDFSFLMSWAYLFTGLVLISTCFLPRGKDRVTFPKAWVIGVAQALALLPGISRSGMTITAGRLLKVSPEKCAEFSFLMSAPPIIGATLLELISSINQSSETSVSWALVLYGTILAGVSGYFSLKLLVRLLGAGRFWYFGPYCIILAVYLAL